MLVGVRDDDVTIVGIAFLCLLSALQEMHWAYVQFEYILGDILSLLWPSLRRSLCVSMLNRIAWSVGLSCKLQASDVRRWVALSPCLLPFEAHLMAAEVATERFKGLSMCDVYSFLWVDIAKGWRRLRVSMCFAVEIICTLMFVL